MEEVNNTGNVIPGGVGDQGPNNSFNDEVSNNDGGDGSPQSNAQNIAKAMLNTEINNLKNPSVSGITYKGNFKNSSIDAATRMFGNVQNPVPSPSNFTSELRKASADGGLKNNPNFKAAVDADTAKNN